VQNHEVLLGKKKRGFKSGKFFGYGGKVERDDPTVVAAAIREFAEETGGCVPLDLREVGVVFVEFRDEENLEGSGNAEGSGKAEGSSEKAPGKCGKCLEIHVFRSTGVLPNQRAIQETEEMQPCWFGIDEVPWGDCLPDVRNWYPLAMDVAQRAPKVPADTRVSGQHEDSGERSVSVSWGFFRAEYVLDAASDAVLYERVVLFDEIAGSGETVLCEFVDEERLGKVEKEEVEQKIGGHNGPEQGNTNEQN